jgi:hypothetical protein
MDVKSYIKLAIGPGLHVVSKAKFSKLVTITITVIVISLENFTFEATRIPGPSVTKLFTVVIYKLTS